MFDFIKKGASLNKIIEEIIHEESNKQSHGITGYLNNGLFEREDVDKGCSYI